MNRFPPTHGRVPCLTPAGMRSVLTTSLLALATRAQVRGVGRRGRK